MNKNVNGILTTREGPQGLIEILKDHQKETGYLSREFLAKTAHVLELPLSAVYGVATFYSFLSVKPRAKNIIRVCNNLPCLLESSQTMVDYLEKKLGIKPGGTTSDSIFSLELTNCIGACDKAPAMMINDRIYGNLTAARISSILKTYR